jgi:8-oxo-dGTP pyrophosphatase MutT (NUDIX family)
MTSQSNQANRLTQVSRRQDWPNSRPRDAATLIIVDTSESEPRVLMGRRHDAHVFLPGKFVFPGGRISPADSRLRTRDDLDPVVMRKLLFDMKGKPSPDRARGLALTAVRETFEETGLLIGRPRGQNSSTRSPLWRDFLGQGVTPSLAGMRFIARAITPPRRPRRFDTRFFFTTHEAIASSVEIENRELLDLHWLTFPKAQALDLPTITQVVLDELQSHLRGGRLPPKDAPVPYYYMRHGRFERQLI